MEGHAGAAGLNHIDVADGSPERAGGDHRTAPLSVAPSILLIHSTFRFTLYL
jgi:hypothetical protein